MMRKLKIGLLVIWIWCLLGIVRLMILIFPFRKVAGVMGRSNQETTYSLPERKQQRAKILGSWIMYIASHTPWESKCLVQALTGLITLGLLGIPGTIYLGVNRDNNNRLTAHAWLRAGNEVVTGEDEMHKFTPVAKYSRFAGKNRGL